MADNRQFADHVEIGGANVYFQETSTTDTTMPSTSFFKTEDVDGKPVIISRDNIMGIVKDCLGSILNGLTDQTTVTKVPTLNGDTLGASAVSTLASVLGAGVAAVNAINPDVLLTDYRGKIVSASFTNNASCPITNGPCVVVSINTSYAIQFAFNPDQSTSVPTTVYVRTSTNAVTFKSWMKLAFSS